MGAVRDRVALSRTEIYRKINKGEFPRPIPLGTHRVAFVESEIIEWMASRVEARKSREGAAARREQGRYAVAQREARR
ncbi:MAG: AlpA family phage regulatory protein [Alphaproteobacteria bacterium]|nr:AlpA family phage regulatory protein [Alphaproteobacteria bacterium]